MQYHVTLRYFFISYHVYSPRYYNEEIKKGDASEFRFGGQKKISDTLSYTVQKEGRKMHFYSLQHFHDFCFAPLLILTATEWMVCMNCVENTKLVLNCYALLPFGIWHDILCCRPDILYLLFSYNNNNVTFYNEWW